MGYPVTKSFNTVKHSNRETRLKKRQKQRLLILAMLTVVMLLVLMLLIFAVCSIVNAVKNNDSEDGNDAPPPTAMQFDLITRLSSESHSYGPLLLINNSKRFDAFDEVESNLVALTPARDENGDPYYKTAASGLRLNKDALVAFNKMMAIYGDGKITVTTTYRDYETQAGMTGATAAAAGYSDHHSGYLIAFDDAAIGTTTFSNILENCHKYGFIVRYPTDKSDLTGIDFNYTECLRYVGVAHANYIKQKNLCLEEYIDLVKGYSANNQLAFYSVNNKQSSYSVYYVPAASTQLTEIQVPQGYRYEISGNNAGGFVVAVYLNEKTA